MNTSSLPSFPLTGTPRGLTNLTVPTSGFYSMSKFLFVHSIIASLLCLQSFSFPLRLKHPSKVTSFSVHYIPPNHMS